MIYFDPAKLPTNYLEEMKVEKFASNHADALAIYLIKSLRAYESLMTILPEDIENIESSVISLFRISTVLAFDEGDH